MPAGGGGYAVLKWVTSFPGNPRARPADGDRRRAALRCVDGRAAGDPRRGRGHRAANRAPPACWPRRRLRGPRWPPPRWSAAASTAARSPARSSSASATCCSTTRCRGQAEIAAEELGERATVARDLAEALAADIVVTVTPGREILFDDGELHAGQHVSLMGADGPGKAEIAVGELLRARVVCDEWEQASHNGDLGRAFDEGGSAATTSPSSGPVLLGLQEGAAGRARDHGRSTRRASRCRISRSRSPCTSGSTGARGDFAERRRRSSWASRARPAGRAHTSRSTIRDRASRRRDRPARAPAGRPTR